MHLAPEYVCLCERERDRERERESEGEKERVRLRERTRKRERERERHRLASEEESAGQEGGEAHGALFGGAPLLDQLVECRLMYGRVRVRLH